MTLRFRSDNGEHYCRFTVAHDLTAQQIVQCVLSALVSGETLEDLGNQEVLMAAVEEQLAAEGRQALYAGAGIDPALVAQAKVLVAQFLPAARVIDLMRGPVERFEAAADLEKRGIVEAGEEEDS